MNTSVNSREDFLKNLVMQVVLKENTEFKSAVLPLVVWIRTVWLDWIALIKNVFFYN